MIQRKKPSSSKVNLTISVVFHCALIAAIVFFAAREGMLGKKLRQITVTMVPKEKKPEPPKEKPPEPKIEQPKVADSPKPVAPPPQAIAAAPPPSDSSPAAAPAASALAGFEFSDGAHQVDSVSDPNGIYKGSVEHSLRSRWNRPQDMVDDNFVADVEVTVELDGTVDGYRWIRGSGNERWDKSVRDVMDQTKVLDRPPQKGFPTTFVVRFDVQSEKVEDTIQLSTR